MRKTKKSIIMKNKKKMSRKRKMSRKKSYKKSKNRKQRGSGFFLFNIFKSGCNKYQTSMRIADKEGCGKDSNCKYEERGSSGSFCFEKKQLKTKKTKKTKNTKKKQKTKEKK